MNRFIKLLLVIIFFLALFFGSLIFSGHHFCWLPVTDNGPGTFGCFYSSE